MVGFWIILNGLVGVDVIVYVIGIFGLVIVIVCRYFVVVLVLVMVIVVGSLVMMGGEFGVIVMVRVLDVDFKLLEYVMVSVNDDVLLNVGLFVSLIVYVNNRNNDVFYKY